MGRGAAFLLLLFAVAEVSSSNISRPSLERLDRFHRELLKSRILHRLRLSQAPSWPHSQPRNLSSFRPPAPPGALHHLYLRMLPKSYQLRDTTDSCEVVFQFESNLGNGERTLVASGGDLWLPRPWNGGGNVGLRLRGEDIPIRRSNKSRAGFELWELDPGALRRLGRRQEALEVVVEAGCGREGNETDEEEQPFLLLRVEESEDRGGRPRKRNSRGRDLVRDCEAEWDRGMLETMDSGTFNSLLPCCRREIEVDFESIGWSHWLLAPQRFTSYYCLGRCSAYGGFAVEETDGPSLYAEIMNFQGLGLSPCCTPVRFRPLTVTVRTGEQEEMTQTLDDILVHSCGCL